MTGQNAQVQYVNTTTGNLTEDKVYDVVAWIGDGSSNQPVALIADDNGEPYAAALISADWVSHRF